MALELERLKKTADALRLQTKENQERYLKAALIANDGLAEDLPALSEYDRAAVSWYISTMVAQILQFSVADLSDIIADTSIGYALAACKLTGVIP